MTFLHPTLAMAALGARTAVPCGSCCWSCDCRAVGRPRTHRFDRIAYMDCGDRQWCDERAQDRLE